MQNDIRKRDAGLSEKLMEMRNASSNHSNRSRIGEPSIFLMTEYVDKTQQLTRLTVIEDCEDAFDLNYRKETT